MTPEDGYLIRKHGGYYRPNCRGYTDDFYAAGRYTLADAIRFTHPNGPDGPRDGMSYVHQSEVARYPIRAEVLAELPEVRALVAAETERCAKIAEHFRDMCGECHWPEDAVIAGGNVANDIAAAIRDASNG